ncbi:MFS general substrate transporter [Auricularia subglabra TFB-10046 SS5]|uniref:MFS general substrate transporter n=1 Tax=Auricularia subglabra (strain TFB-10046 / SS5) TaxID=717982 RepID=J0LCF2_AURST|nr:MFS general substrate transporter [Auricularia subglabra TFB-10046 SS5]
MLAFAVLVSLHAALGGLDAVHVGVYTSGPFWGKIVDSRGPRILFTSALFLLSGGYFGIRAFYDGVFDFLSPDGISWFAMALLVLFAICSGLGGNAGLTAAVNATAKSFPDTLRATTTGLVLSGFGLSAFLFSAIAHTAFPGDTSSFLLLLALGTSLPMLVGIFFVRPVPLVLPASHPEDGALDEVNERLLADRDREHDAFASIVGGGVFENVDAEESATPLLASEVSSINEPDSDGSALMVDSSSSSSSGTATPKANEAERDNRENGRDTSMSHLQFPDFQRSPSRRRSRTLSKMRAHGHGEHGDVYGKALFRKTEFWIIFVIISLLSGTGLMWLNNVGSVAQALYAHANPTTFPTDEGIEATSKLQAKNVSFTSLGNCVGRILIGVLADIGRAHWGVSRPSFLCLVAAAFIFSQIVAARIEDPDALWIASGLLGVAYGGLFGLYPVIIIEWFGLAGGNIFSLAFGRNLDAHAPHPDAATDSVLASPASAALLSPPLANVARLLEGIPIEHAGNKAKRWLLARAGGVSAKPDASHQCMQGNACYVASLQMTTAACVLALGGLSIWAALRDRKRRIARDRRHARG